MKDDIKRMAQLLFDNAEFIALELKGDGKHYRSLAVQFMDFSSCDKIALTIYDERTTTMKLEGRRIHIVALKSIFHRLNEEVGIIADPEPVEIRESLC